MKKFLSLVLALVMTMSLVTISAGAKDFSDADAITYDEAVDVLTAIGVVDGYTDGAFKPGNALNRGQAAKIICNLILGSTTADKLNSDTQLFKDVPVDHTFAAYIAFCVEEGIVSGYADGSFKPGNPLTRYAFLKMLLGALGYDSETEGYVGENWSINVAKRALGIGLNKGLKSDFNGFDTVVREEAALYALNTLKATMVEYDQKTTINVGTASIALSGNLQEISWGEGTKNDGNIEKDGFVQFAEKHFPKLELDAEPGMYGRPTNEWKNAKKLIGTYASIDPTYVYIESTDEKDVYKDLGEDIIDEYSWTAYVNGVMQADESKPSKTLKEEWIYTGEGSVVEVYVKDEVRNIYGEVVDWGEVTVVEINHYLGQVSKVKSDEDGEYITIDEVGYKTGLEDKTFYVEGYEEDDYVVYTIDENEDGDIVIAEVCKPETVTVEVTRVQKDDVTGATYLRADGEKYVYTEDYSTLTDNSYEAEHQDHMVYDLDEKTNEKIHPTLNEDYVLYLDPNGFVMAFALADEKVDQYLYVLDSDEEMGDWTAKVLLTDGTTVKVELEEDTEDAWCDWVPATGDGDTYDKVNNSTIDNRVWKYSVNDDGEYELEYIPYNTLENGEYISKILVDTDPDGMVTKITTDSDGDKDVDKDDDPDEAEEGDEQNRVTTDEDTDTVVEINNGKAYIDTGDDDMIIVDQKTVFVDKEGKTAYVGYKEVPNVDNADVIYVVNDNVVTVAFILDGDMYDKNATYFMLGDDEWESLKYDSKLYRDYESVYVNGEKQKSWIVAYNWDGVAGNDAPLVEGELYKVLKTKTVDDVTYITEVEELDYEDDTNDVYKWAVKDKVKAVGVGAFWLDEDLGVNKFDCDDETIFVFAEEETIKEDSGDKVVWHISEGNLKDMEDDNLYGVSVVKADEDDDYAELVYIIAKYTTDKTTDGGDDGDEGGDDPETPVDVTVELAGIEAKYNSDEHSAANVIDAIEGELNKQGYVNVIVDLINVKVTAEMNGRSVTWSLTLTDLKV